MKPNDLFTSKFPTEIGFYVNRQRRRSGTRTVTLIYVEFGENEDRFVVRDGDDDFTDISEIGGEWLGPIEGDVSW